MTSQGPDIWTNLSGLANVVLGAIALFLLFQGQSDRRKLAAQARAEQAKRVTFTFEHIYEKTSDTSYSVCGIRAVIRNASDYPISFGFPPQLAVYQRPSWDDYLAGDPAMDLWRTKNIDLPHAFLGAGEVEIIEQPLIGYDGARIGFADSEGNWWVRTGEDGKLFPSNPPPTVRSRVYQLVCRLKPCYWLLMHLPSRYAAWRFTRSDEVPLTARWLRFWWGHVPMGEPALFLLPRSAPIDDWPYYEWMRQSRIFAEHQQQPRLESQSRETDRHT